MASFESQRVEAEEEREEEEEEERWVKHYSSYHEILLVGEGDFSFSLSLATAFGSADNITATSLDSHDTVVSKYNKARSNLESLEKMGATILHGVDATKMKLHSDLKMRKFDRIVYNFPHAGFKGKEDQIRLINLHRQLVHGFLRNASRMLRLNGEVHVTHKTENPYNKWKLEELASKNYLVLTERTDFNINHYPGYNNKRGDGVNCDQPFRLGECCTYKFQIGDIHEMKKAQKKKAALSHMNAVHGSKDNCSLITVGFDHSLANQNPQADYRPNILGRPQAAFSEGIPCSPPRNWIRSPLPSDAEGIQTRVYTPLGIRTSNSQHSDFATGLEGIPRWISSIPQTSFGTSGERFPRRFYSPPRIGISTVSSGAFGDHSDDLRNTVRRFVPDIRHVDQGVLRNVHEPRTGIWEAYGYHSDDVRDIMARYGYHSDDIRDLIARYGLDYRHAGCGFMGNVNERYMHPEEPNYWSGPGKVWP